MFDFFGEVEFVYAFCLLVGRSDLMYVRQTVMPFQSLTSVATSLRNLTDDRCYMPLVTSLSLIINLSFGNLFFLIWIMITLILRVWG